MYRQALTRILLRGPAKVASPFSVHFPVAGLRCPSRPAPQFTQLRKFVIEVDQKAKIYSYDQMKALSANLPEKKDVVLVDVREPSEFNEGHIPGAINVPFKSSPGALGLDAEDFQDKFGMAKPDPKKELIFYCLAGVRSSAAEELAATFGYKHRGNYKGSWEDWVKNSSV